MDAQGYLLLSLAFVYLALIVALNGKQGGETCKALSCTIELGPFA
jgi:hypothetical protein